MRKNLARLTLAVLTLSGAAYAQRGPSGPTPVITAPVVKQAFSDKLEALGTAKANETVIITPDTTEKIAVIAFEDGQEVKQGDILVELDSNQEKAELRALEAELTEAQSSYNRAKDLQGSRAISAATLSERLSALRRAQADVEAIKARLAELSIVAPFDGVLGLREVSVGGLVQPGDRITTIDDLSQIKVDFDVPSVFLPSLKAGLKVTAKVDAYEDMEFTGEVTTINTQIDPVTRTVRVRAIIQNPDRLLKPGLLMTIILERNDRTALLIPEEALIKRADKNFVFVIQDKDGQQTAVQTPVEIGTRRPGAVEILAGLQEGDQVVAHGTVKVNDGAAVTIKATENDNETLDTLLKQQPAAGATTE